MKDPNIPEVKRTEVKPENAPYMSSLKTADAIKEDVVFVDSEKVKPTNKKLIYITAVAVVGLLVAWHYRGNIAGGPIRNSMTPTDTSEKGNNDLSLSANSFNGIIEDSVNSVKDSLKSNKDAKETLSSVTITQYPYFGIFYYQVDAQVKAANHLMVDYGALVKSGSKSDEIAVVPDSPADKAGIVEGDVILEADGIKLEKVSLASVIHTKKIGEVVNLTIFRNGKELTADVTLEAQPDNSN